MANFRRLQNLVFQIKLNISIAVKGELKKYISYWQILKGNKYFNWSQKRIKKK